MGDSSHLEHKSSEPELKLEVKKGFSTVEVVGSGWDDQGHDSDQKDSRIIKTVAVTQSRHDA